MDQQSPFSTKWPSAASRLLSDQAERPPVQKQCLQCKQAARYQVSQSCLKGNFRKYWKQKLKYFPGLRPPGPSWIGASVLLSDLNGLSNPSSPSFALHVNSFICAVFFSSLPGLLALWGLLLSSSLMSWHSPDPCCQRCFSQPSVWLSISSLSLSHCFYIFLGPFFTEMCHCSLFLRLMV